MHKMILGLLFTAAVACGCANQTVNIVSNPAGAEVYANQDRIGNTPLLASIDEIMPLWGYNGTIAQAVITLRKSGYEDYKVFVNKFYMPNQINANLVPISVVTNRIDNNVSDTKERIENRLSIIKSLFDKGTITREEYESKRKEILNGL
jgi:hypothetical protein